MEQHAKRAFDDLVNSYNIAARLNDESMMAMALAIPIPESVLRHPELHSKIRRYRGNTFVRIGQNAAADREYEMGFYEAEPEERGDYVLDWAMASFARLYDPKDGAASETIVERCLEILGLSDQLATEASHSSYTLVCTSYARAFLYVFCGDRAAAKTELARHSLPVLPPGYRTDLRLNSFFTHLPKGLLAALELKDQQLIRAVSLGGLVSSERRQFSDDSASAGTQFIQVIAQRSHDVPKFGSSWVITLELIHLLFPRFQTSRRLRLLVKGRSEPRELAAFVDSLHVL